MSYGFGSGYGSYRGYRAPQQNNGFGYSNNSNNSLVSYQQHSYPPSPPASQQTNTPRYAATTPQGLTPALDSNPDFFKNIDRSIFTAQEIRRLNEINAETTQLKNKLLEQGGKGREISLKITSLFNESMEIKRVAEERRRQTQYTHVHTNNVNTSNSQNRQAYDSRERSPVSSSNAESHDPDNSLSSLLQDVSISFNPLDKTPQESQQIRELSAELKRLEKQMETALPHEKASLNQKLINQRMKIFEALMDIEKRQNDARTKQETSEKQSSLKALQMERKRLEEEEVQAQRNEQQRAEQQRRRERERAEAAERQMREAEKERQEQIQKLRNEVRSHGAEVSSLEKTLSELQESLREAQREVEEWARHNSSQYRPNVYTDPQYGSGLFFNKAKQDTQIWMNKHYEENLGSQKAKVRKIEGQINIYSAQLSGTKKKLNALIAELNKLE